jgi:hypothetical protein
MHKWIKEKKESKSKKNSDSCAIIFHWKITSIGTLIFQSFYLAQVHFSRVWLFLDTDKREWVLRINFTSWKIGSLIFVPHNKIIPLLALQIYKVAYLKCKTHQGSKNLESDTWNLFFYHESWDVKSALFLSQGF